MHHFTLWVAVAAAIGVGAGMDLRPAWASSANADSQAPSLGESHPDWPAVVRLIAEPMAQLTAPRPIKTLEPELAGNRAARRVLDVLRRIEDGLQHTHYQGRTQVRVKDGYYAWDCSGMTSWILSRAAPRARKTLRSSRPVARTYLRRIQRAPSKRSRGGWRKIANIEDVRPGDIFAWLRPTEWPKGATGHVGFIASKPEPVDHIANAYVVRIVDSTRYPHQDDERETGVQDGFGSGTILFVVDDDGAPIAYGWHGLDSSWVVETEIAFGRVSR